MTKQVYNLTDVFEMTGSDAIEFFNNQIISTLKPDGSVQFSAICNPKGRIIFTLVLKATTENICVAVDASLSDNFLQYVNMRRFRMNLNINKVEKLLAFNPTEQQGLEFDFITNETAHEVIEHDQFWSHMFDMKLPWVTAVTTEKFIPQHLNLDQNDTIDFAKGCYPGQEIIARLHFIGQIKKRMQHISYKNTEPYLPGSTVKLPPKEVDAEICAPSIFSNNQWHSQAIIRTADSTSAT